MGMLEKLVKLIREALDEPPELPDEAGLSSDDDVVLPLEAVDALIRRYAQPRGRMQLKRRYDDLSFLSKKLPKGRVTQTGALYDYGTQTMFLSLKKRPLANVVEDVLHEIHHFNQHVQWATQPSSRVEFVEGHDLPSGFRASDLSALSFDDLVRYWYLIYGYEGAPHELDAVIFASEHLDEALGLVLP